MRTHLKDPNYLHNKNYYENHIKCIKFESYSIKYLMKLYSSKENQKNIRKTIKKFKTEDITKKIDEQIKIKEIKPENGQKKEENENIGINRNFNVDNIYDSINNINNNLINMGNNVFDFYKSRFPNINNINNLINNNNNLLNINNKFNKNFQSNNLNNINLNNMNNFQYRNNIHNKSNINYNFSLPFDNNNFYNEYYNSFLNLSFSNVINLNFLNLQGNSLTNNLLKANLDILNSYMSTKINQNKGSDK